MKHEKTLEFQFGHRKTPGIARGDISRYHPVLVHDWHEPSFSITLVRVRAYWNSALMLTGESYHNNAGFHLTPAL
jgi:hypothetical protein